MTKQGKVATTPWLHHWTRLWSSEDIQTFWNVSLNKLASLRGADRPFIVAAAGPMASMNRAAVLWFPVQATMINECQRGRRQRSLSPPPQPPSPHLSAHYFSHMSTFMAPRGSEWQRSAIKGKGLFPLPSRWNSKKNGKRSELILQQHWRVKEPVSKGDFRRIWRLQVRIKKHYMPHS